MTSEFAKKLVVDMGKRLIKSKLTIRTWGNVSVRISEDLFAISPSSYFYDSMKPEDVVVLNVNKPDEYGKIKPSSERHIHSEIYKLDSSVNFIIHTHQKFATALAGCSEIFEVKKEKHQNVLGDFIPVIKYAPAGTKKLAKNVISCLNKNFAHTLLIPQHGIISFGMSLEDVFKQAETVEDFCKDYIFTADYGLAFEHYRYERKTSTPLLNFYASKRLGDFCFIYDKKTEMRICKIDIESGKIIAGDFDFTSDLHCKIYRERPDINFIEQSTQPASLYVAKRIKPKQIIPAFIEDFAQMAGENINARSFFENRADKLSREIIDMLKGRNAITIVDSGVLCCVSEEKDMFPLKEIVEKNLLAFALSLKFTNAKPLPPRTVKKMRKGYLSDHFA